MKVIAAIIICGSAAVALSTAAQESPDTVMNVTGAKSVVITNDGSGVNISVTDPDGEPYDYYVDNPTDGHMSTFQSWNRINLNNCDRGGCDDPSRWSGSVVFSGIDFGFITGCGDVPVETNRSFEVGIENLLSLSINSPAIHPWQSSFSFGFGLNWRIYSMTRATSFAAYPDGNVFLSGWMDGINPKKSRLNTFSLQFPVLYKLATPAKLWGGRLSFTAGAVLNWNTYAGITNSWQDADFIDCSAHYGSLHQRHFTCDILGKVNIGEIGLYIRYSPMSIFSKANGPEMCPLMVGFTLF